MREPVAPDRTAEPCQNPGPGDPFGSDSRQPRGLEEQQEKGGGVQSSRHSFWTPPSYETRYRQHFRSDKALQTFVQGVCPNPSLAVCAHPDNRH